MALLEPVTNLLLPGQTASTANSNGVNGSTSSNGSLSSLGAFGNKADSVTLSDNARTNSANSMIGNTARTNSASAAAQQAKNASASVTPAAKQASDAGADYSQAFRSLAALNKMTQAYNKAIETAANSTSNANAQASARASGEAAKSRANDMSGSAGAAMTDNTQMATDMSRSGTLSSILMSSQTQSVDSKNQIPVSDKRNAVSGVAKV